MDDGPCDGSTKPSISPEEKSIVNDINLSNDEFFASTFKTIEKPEIIKDVSLPSPIKVENKETPKP